MLSAHIDIDLTRFEAKLTSAQRRDLPKAELLALNWLAYDGMKAVRSKMKVVFDRPTPYAMRGIIYAVRRLNQDFFELIPQFKIILSGNHKPIIRDDSDGIWRRVKLVPWDVQIPESDVDRDLPRKLRGEKAGIFAWMVKGALDYLQRGLMEPEGISAATREYREENDPLGAFVRGACMVTGSDGDRESPLDLFNAYSRFARREGLSEFKQATFTKRFPDQTRKNWKGEDGLMHSFRKGKSSVTVYYGIRIRDEFREQVGAAAGYHDDGPLPEPF